MIRSPQSPITPFLRSSRRARCSCSIKSASPHARSDDVRCLVIGPVAFKLPEAFLPSVASSPWMVRLSCSSSAQQAYGLVARTLEIDQGL